MESLRSVVAARLGGVLAATVLVIAATACAADPGSGRSGGLVPAPRKTREELVREWDLNSDGKIDQGEAEVAASRMRRERAELRLNSGIDPITGRPRGEESAEAAAENQERAADEAEAAETMPEEEPEAVDAGRDEDERPALPGTRVPKPRLPGPKQPAGKADLNAALKPSMNGATDRSRRPVTGGTRAGGLPAQAGYGSGVPTRPLNAGQPVAPKVRVIVPQAPRGGLTPSSRPAATVVRPAAPPPPRPTGPREAYNPY